MRVLITDHVHELLIENLISSSYQVDYYPDIDNQYIKSIIHQYHVVVINTRTPFNREMIDMSKSLRLIVRLGSGLDIIDCEYADQKGIHVCNTPEGNRQAVAEHALGLLLGLLNRIVISNEQVKSLTWRREENRGIEIEGKTLGIIGFGNTGSSFAKLLSGFNLKILAYDKYKQRFAENYRNVIETDMTEIFRNCDVLSLHIPLTSETVHLCDMNFFKRFEKDIFLLNTSRGKIIKTSDLISCIRSGKIKGAALDVLENENPGSYNGNEKLMYEQLFSFSNVIVTPHIAGWSVESKEKIAELTYKCIIQYAPV
ncbi:MAG: NAD(P)-dependent oxidoreductase [Deltaproteobacteria bacterium]